ncbi:MAG: winged helix-turn-helix transcriptional regulator [Alphaproteobacteria bacterium]|nr:winged helix-turn-helix transcriptional regulator [Alphaproteobacteria bacterium]
MAAFQDTREHTEQKVMVHLLTEIERNPSFTQRSLASELGIALGLMNQYLKSCVTKGWVRASQVSPRRITYFLTPDGFKEKSHMVTSYLARSLTFFRDARAQCDTLFDVCLQKGWTKIAFVGEGDLADIAQLVAQGLSLHVKVVLPTENLKAYDAVLVTDVINPQATYDFIRGQVDSDRLLTLDLLHISRDSKMQKGVA